MRANDRDDPHRRQRHYRAPAVTPSVVTAGHPLSGMTQPWRPHRSANSAPIQGGRPGPVAAHVCSGPRVLSLGGAGCAAAGGSGRRECMMAAGLGSTWWQYLLLFLAVAASWAGVPAIGTAALGAAAVAASQGRLDLTAVIVVATIAGEAGGLGGYAIGRRWGRQLLGRPGRHHARRVRPPAIRPQDRRPGPGHGVEQRRHPVRRVILGAVVYGETLSAPGSHARRTCAASFTSRNSVPRLLWCNADGHDRYCTTAGSRRR